MIMKKIKTLLILGALLMVGIAGFSQSIEYRFNNFQVVPGPGPDTLIFDVEARSNTSTTYTTTFSLKINFSSTAFGANAVPIVVQPLVLGQPIGYNFNTLAISVSATRFATTFQANRLFAPFNAFGNTYQTAYLSNLTTSYQGLVRYKMLITGTGNLGVEFYITGYGSMQTGQNYVLTSGGTLTTPYSPITAANTMINLPPDPTNFDLLISEVGDPSNSSTNFVEIYNAGASSINFGAYPWFLSFNNASSVQLTGTLAAGAAYTVAYDNVDFTPDLVSTLVGTGGTTDYLLSLYSNYVDGQAIDAFTFDFAGKHAVRHYDIVSPNVTPTASEWVFSAAEDIDMTPGSHRGSVNWSGVNDAWRDRANWAEGLIPDAAHDVYIPNSGIGPVINYSSNAFANNLSIGFAGLVIESDAVNGDGSLITFGTVTGSAVVQRYLGADRYWYVSQPVTSEVAGVFLHMWLFTYNEPGSAWAPFIADETTPLELMRGYAVWTSSINSWDPEEPPIGSTTRNYEGSLNTGDISRALTASGDGWNFTGNPYPSAVNWEAAGWTKTSLTTDAYSVWNGVNYGTYTVGSGGTNGATEIIPAAQGFFVNASAAGTLGVSNAVRTHSTLDFWKNQENRLNRLSMIVSNGTISDETVIYFNEEATTELDYSYDALKLMAPATPQAYTMLGESRMAINAFNNMTQTSNVKLGVSAPEAGEFTLSASNIESFDVNTPIYLEDLSNGTIVNLRENSTYTFTADEGTAERFLVHFTAVQGIGDDPAAEVSNIYAVNRQVYVNFTATKGEISVYNILGQEISRTIAFNGLNTVDVPQGNAVYIVKVVSDNSTVTKKVFVK